MQFGRYYEEFEVGATYKHWPGKTVTEYDDHLFCLLTMNHHPLHLDAHYAEQTDRLRQERRGGQLHLLAAARHVGARRQRQGDRQPRGRVAQAREADLPRRHDLRRDDRAGQDRVEVQGRPRRRARRDPRLQPGRRRRLRLPAQGDGAEAVVRRRARRRAARPARSRRRADGTSGGGAVAVRGPEGAQHADLVLELVVPPERTGGRRRQPGGGRRSSRPVVHDDDLAAELVLDLDLADLSHGITIGGSACTTRPRRVSEVPIHQVAAAITRNATPASAVRALPPKRPPLSSTSRPDEDLVGEHGQHERPPLPPGQPEPDAVQEGRAPCQHRRSPHLSVGAETANS